MKVWNLTDVVTPALRRAGNVRRPLVLARYILNPGESVEVADELFDSEPHLRRQAEDYVRRGMLSLGLPPPAYLRVKDR